MSKIERDAAKKERDRIIKLVSGLTIPLSGWDRIESRAEFAAFNMGRYQQAVILAIEGKLRPEVRDGEG